MTQEELGAICGTTKQSIFKYETGVVTNIPLDRLEKIAAALDVSPAYLMGWEDTLIAAIAEDNAEGRTGAKEDMFRTFGKDYNTASSRLMGDKVAILYYKALERQDAPELLSLIDSVDDMATADLSHIRGLVQAYLQAGTPIREIVNTALRPYWPKDSV